MYYTWNIFVKIYIYISSHQLILCQFPHVSEINFYISTLHRRKCLSSLWATYYSKRNRDIAVIFVFDFDLIEFQLHGRVRVSVTAIPIILFTLYLWNVLPRWMINDDDDHEHDICFFHISLGCMRYTIWTKSWKMKELISKAELSFEILKFLKWLDFVEKYFNNNAIRRKEKNSNRK